MATNRAMVVKEANEPFVLEEREVPEPKRGEVRVRVDACGICHSDAFTKTGGFPGLELPRVPGHEVAGVVDAVGEGVTRLSKGDRVGIGWHGGHCFECRACRRGDFIGCEKAQICGVTYDSGYQDYLVAPAEAAAVIPDALSPVDAGPLLCAGVTTFNALRNSGARAGDTVAVQGIGGLGHLGVQWARKMGFRTIAISRGDDKKDLAEKLGAHEYVDAKANDPASALQKLGGADVILATAPNAKAVSSVLGGLKARGTLMLVGAIGEPIQVNGFAMLSGKQLHGWPSGTAVDSEDTLRFAALTDVRPETEVFELEQADEGYARVMENQARFRAVLKLR